ncbi:hypothetical protein PF010_g31345 [Phytophthora fragariae]|uniref:Secreted protein n=1 Tax=Phytophthora fragariae TaxID=53985 RepID=A0A6G0MAB0_9STRA|nr:hypothetical protein PF010_g31345 [Phytophthora fragariae]KAE9160611.1 hypothetical protein PF004_g31118 [Phytophthora fragariae]
MRSMWRSRTFGSLLLPSLQTVPTGTRLNNCGCAKCKGTVAVWRSKVSLKERWLPSGEPCLR